MLITRSGILREVLAEKQDLMYRYSKHRAGLTPLEGYEQLFSDLKETCDLLRGMIKDEMCRERDAWLMDIARENRDALAHPEIQQRLADWQKELMAGKKPGVEWADQQVTRTPDELLRRRRRDRAEGFKPEPVTYPGGE